MEELPEEAIWICILEKAWDKLHGSYCMTRQDSTSVAYRALTGFPLIFQAHEYVELVHQKSRVTNYLTTNLTTLSFVFGCLFGAVLTINAQWTTVASGYRQPPHLL